MTDAEKKVMLSPRWHSLNHEQRQQVLEMARQRGDDTDTSAQPTPVKHGSPLMRAVVNKASFGALPGATPTPSPQPPLSLLPPGPPRQNDLSWLMPSKTQLGIDAATLAAGVLAPEALVGSKLLQGVTKFGPAAAKLARGGISAARLALPALGGAAGARLEGKSAAGGAAQGVIEQGVGKLLTMPAEGWLQRKLDVKRIARTIKEQFPWLGRVENARDIERLFVEGHAVTGTGKRLNKIKETIGKRLYQRPLPLTPNLARVFAETDSPVTQIVQGQSTSQAATFEELDKSLTLLWEMARLPNGNPRTSATSPELLRLYHNAVEDAQAVLNQMHKGLGNRYIKARGEFADARTIKDLFQPEGMMRPVVMDKGVLDSQLLQQRLMDPDLARYAATSKRVGRLANAINRGPKMQAGVDVPFGLRIHFFSTGKGIHPVGRVEPGKAIIPRHIGRTAEPWLRAGVTAGIPELLQAGLGQPIEGR